MSSIVYLNCLKRLCNLFAQVGDHCIAYEISRTARNVLGSAQKNNICEDVENHANNQVKPRGCNRSQSVSICKTHAMALHMLQQSVNSII